MGKGFTIEGVEGHDLAALFLEAFRRKVNSERVLESVMLKKCLFLECQRKSYCFVKRHSWYTSRPCLHQP